MAQPSFKMEMVINNKNRSIPVTDLGKGSFLDQFWMAKEKGLVAAPLAIIDEGIMQGKINRVSWTGNLRLNGPFEAGKNSATNNGNFVLQAGVAAKIQGMVYGKGEVSIIPYAAQISEGNIIVPDMRLTYMATNLSFDGKGGQVEPVIRLPVNVPKEVWDVLPDDQKRWFYGRDGPLARGYFALVFLVRRDVVGDGVPGFRLGVYGVKPEVLEMLAEAEPVVRGQIVSVPVAEQAPATSEQGTANAQKLKQLGAQAGDEAAQLEKTGLKLPPGIVQLIDFAKKDQ